MLHTVLLCYTYYARTWRLSVVGEVGHEQRLRVHHDDGVGVHAVHAAQRAHLGGPRELQLAGDRHVAEVHLHRNTTYCSYSYQT